MAGRNTPGTQPVPREDAAFEAFLRKRKLKLTSERMEILRAIFAKHAHFDAESLHVELKQAGAQASRATVYRTLDLLVQAGLVRKNSLGASHAIYEALHDDAHHDHLVCMGCGTVIEFFREDLERLQVSICKDHGFRPLHHSLQIFGVCRTCEGRVDEGSLQDRIAQLHA